MQPSIFSFIHYTEITFPNGYEGDCRGKTCIFLQLKFKNVKKVETDFTFTIESANYSNKKRSVYEKSDSRGIPVCSTEEFFDPEKKCIIDGKFTVKVDGIFKFETALPAEIAENQQTWIGGKMGDEFWSKNGTKDFTIITSDGKEIKVHKFILANRSEVFNTAFNLKNESIKREKTDFSFKVVETGAKLIYECNFTTKLSMNQLMELLQYFNKFDIQALKAEVEPYLIKQISAATVVDLVNCSIQSNSFKLKEKCIEFLSTAFASKTPLSDIKTLNKDIALQILENSHRQTSETNITSTNVSVKEQKWEGGDLGDKLWNHHETKDFTIFVDGEQIKAHKFILGVHSQMFNEISKAENKTKIINFSSIVFENFIKLMYGCQITTELSMDELMSLKHFFNFSPKVVETGIKLIYDCNFTTSFSMEELMSLLYFLDKYQLPTLKVKVEPFLIAQISPTTVVRLTNCSILTNSFKLKKQCMEFLMAAFESKTPLSDIKNLNKNIALKIFENSLYQHVETEDY